MSAAETASENNTEMPKITINPQRLETLAQNLTQIRSRISSTLQTRTGSLSTSGENSPTPRLVAVSKLKPASDILALHNQPSEQLHFGENYVQELLEKSRLLPRSIRWHFIGGLQSNKCAQLAREVSNLWAVESVDSTKKADLLNKGRGEAASKHEKSQEELLRVFIQVNTSGEESKSGLPPKSSELLELVKHIQNKCSNLKLQGLMTIGAIARSQATTPENENEDFVCLRETRDWVVEQISSGSGDKLELELSMGMSEDFEGAIVQGSDEVRVGSTIFGERPPKSEAKVLEDTEAEKK